MVPDGVAKDDEVGGRGEFGGKGFQQQIRVGNDRALVIHGCYPLRWGRNVACTLARDEGTQHAVRSVTERCCEVLPSCAGVAKSPVGRERPEQPATAWRRGRATVAR